MRYLRAKNPAHVSLVCMGREALEPTDEGTTRAEFLRDWLADRATDPAAIRELLRDFELCLSLDRFDFVLQAERVAPEVCRLREVPA